MSLKTKSTHEKDQEETDTQEEDELSSEDRNSKSKDFLKTSQTSERKTFSPLTLIREEMMKVFKDKDVNPRTSQSEEKLIHPLTLFKEDLNHLKEDFVSFLKISPPKERDDKDMAVKKDSSNTSRAKNSKSDRANQPLKSLFKSNGTFLKSFKKVQDTKDVEKSKEHVQEDFRNSRKQNKVGDESEESKKMEDSEHVMCASATAVKLHESNVWTDNSPVVSGEEEEDETSETPSTGLISFSLKDNLSKNHQTEDLWSLKNFAIYLTLDPNTANSEIHLTERNRKASRLWVELGSPERPEHPERFERCPQVLCREGLLDSVYWEVVWRGGADIGVTYNSISRDGDTGSCLLGHNKRSWSLECSEGIYTPCHNRRRFKSSSPQPFTHRVGVFLNWPAGYLSFYGVSQDAMVHLHTFSSTFTEPLYPAFWVWAYDGSVTLCQVELGWERLLLTGGGS